jgi:hypothetical protein
VTKEILFLKKISDVYTSKNYSMKSISDNDVLFFANDTDPTQSLDIFFILQRKELVALKIDENKGR